MSRDRDTPDPLRVAVVGAGPAGMYAIQHLLENPDVVVEVDLLERLPTPWGLVRSGVAPDHQAKKAVTDRHFAFLLADPRVRFLGNVEVGTDIHHEELVSWYDAVIYAVGATGDTRMSVPGEGLPGCRAARDFVSYYNGHPDSADDSFDLSTERAVIVGNGNVALDVARILTMPVSGLERTDIADQALAAVRRSAIREVVVLGRRGPLQAAFSTPELEELEHVEGVDIVVDEADMPSDSALRGAHWVTRRKMETLARMASRAPVPGNKRIVFRFLASPVEILGERKVERVGLTRNRLVRNDDGTVSARATSERSVIDAGMVLRAIGYRGTPFPGLPFDDERGVIENRGGRVAEGGAALPGTYVTGWVKRGCRGIIGTSKKCAGETVSHLLSDALAGRLSAATLDKRAALQRIRARTPSLVLHEGWLAIDHAERDEGRAQGRPRAKLVDRTTLLDAAT